MTVDSGQTMLHLLRIVVSGGRRKLALMLGAVVLLAAMPAAHATLLGAMFGESVVGSEKIVRQTRELGHFTGLSIQLPATIELRQGEEERITIDTSDNLLAQIETVVDGMSLKIRPRDPRMRIHAKTLKIIIEARKISAIEIGSSAALHAASLRAMKLNIAIGGSSQVRFDLLENDVLSVALGGSGVFQAAGQGRELSASIGGSGLVDTGRFKVDIASINIGGAGHVKVAARSTLRMNLAGSGEVGYYGDPKVSSSVVGSATFARLGAMPD